MLLVAALLVTRGAILQHELDFKAHQPGEKCELCLHAAPLSSGAAVVSGLTLAYVSAASDFQPYATAIATGSLFRARARGPPAAVSIV